jgi:hypothetical protein
MSWSHKGIDNFTSLISLLNEEELLHLLDVLSQFGKKITTEDTIRMGQFPGIEHTPKMLVGDLIESIEIEMIVRRDPLFTINKSKPDWRDNIRNYYRKLKSK